MFFYLHMGIAETRVEEELHALQARGNSHRDILEKQFDRETINHVVLMESESYTDVVITDKEGNILNSSASETQFRKYIDKTTVPIPHDGKVVEAEWDKEPYVATVSPIDEKNQLVGYVYMFQNTASVSTLIHRLNQHFIIAGWISVLFTIVIIIFLTKGITKPLIKMKEATSQISKGNYSVSLPHTSDDELGDLAKSIELLATDLSYLTNERNTFLASISHELRTPLTYIKGYADIVRKRDLSKEERDKYLAIIVDETNRLSSLIKELFELAKMDQNTFVIEKEPILLPKFFTKIEEKFTPIFAEKEIEFQMECQPDLVLQADLMKLEQLFYNLLDNAKKYSPKGAKVCLKAWKQKQEIHITVQDTGKGIPEEDIPYIFNRFYRVDKARTRSLGGMGLGLAIVKEIAYAHGADISVRSTINKGTEFHLVFKETGNENYFTSR